MNKRFYLGGLLSFLWLLPLIYFIKFYHLPLNHLSVYVAITTLCLIGLATGLLFINASPLRYALSLTAIILIAASLLPTLKTPFYLELIGLITLLGNFFLPRQTLIILFCLTGSLFLSTVLFPVGDQFDHPKNSLHQALIGSHQLPLYIHIILDEHISPSALPQTVALEKNARAEIVNFYHTYPFTLYTHVYSRYSRTYDSIPNLLNFSLFAQDSYYFPKGPAYQILEENRSFTALSQLGYQLHIFQPAYIDFCHSKGVNYANCYTYPIFNLGALFDYPFSEKSRYRFLVKSYLLESSLYQGMIFAYAYTLEPLAHFFSLNLPRWDWSQNEMSSLYTLNTLKAVEQSVLEHQNENAAFFVHILLPHSPYIYQANCQLNPNPDKWLINYDFGHKGNTPERRAIRYQQYSAQLGCLYRQLNQLFEVWQKAGILDKAVIIINGDHSARLPVRAPTLQNQGTNTWQDFEDTFPALFATHFPGQRKSEINSKWQSLTHAYGMTWEQLFPALSYPIDKDPPYVFLTNDEPNQFVIQPKEPLSAFAPDLTIDSL